MNAGAWRHGLPGEGRRESRDDLSGSPAVFEDFRSPSGGCRRRGDAPDLGHVLRRDQDRAGRGAADYPRFRRLAVASLARAPLVRRSGTRHGAPGADGFGRVRSAQQRRARPCPGLPRTCPLNRVKSTAATYEIWGYGLGTFPASRVALLGNLEFLVGVACAGLLGEAFQPVRALGGALILAGL
jgi:hypothetical protein